MSHVFGRRWDSNGHVPELTASLAHKLMAGVAPRELAEVSGVSVRTLYRWRRELVAIESVRVDGWTATFARRRYQPPVRISAWERAA